MPILAHELADPDKGSGIAMICTFGDTTDVTWWRELQPAHAGPDRARRPVPAGRLLLGRASLDDARRGQRALRRASRARRSTRRARPSSTRFAPRGDLVGEPREITHPVKFYEKGERPLEIVTSRQWFVRTLEHRDELLARGEELRWHPDYMRHRYRSWVEGLNVDWNISRQRFFGVPFPVWYPIDDDGEVDFDRPMLADARAPAGRPLERRARRATTRAQRGQPGGFVGDPDVMDTWATSSLSPEIAGQLGQRPLRARLPHGPAPPGPRDHPHLALLDGRAQPPPVPQPALQRTSLISGWVLDPEPQEDEQVRWQRRDADAAARAARRRRPALLGGRRVGPAPTPPSTRPR